MCLGFLFFFSMRAVGNAHSGDKEQPGIGASHCTGGCKAQA